MWFCSDAGRTQETYYPHAPADAVVHLEAQQRHGQEQLPQQQAHIQQHPSSSEQQQLDEEPPYSIRGPYFDTTASNNVTALVGKTAYLKCRVKNLGNRTVSGWFCGCMDRDGRRSSLCPSPTVFQAPY